MTKLFFLTDEKTDYIRPKVAPDGTLYVIRRPYEQPDPRRITLKDRMKNFGAFFKGAGKLVKYIGDPEQARKEPQIIGQTKEQTQRRMLEGVMVDIARSEKNPQEDGGIAPDTWVLMKETNGQWTEAARGVADYDFDGDGLILSDGRRILRLTASGKEVLYRGDFVSRIAVVQ